MTSVSTINVPFHGNNLYVVNFNGEPYVPMKPIVEGMGLDWMGQYRKLTQRFSKGIEEMSIPTKGGEQSMLCLALRKLAGWLHTISPNKVKPEIRDKVIKYQEECDDVLYEYWTTGEVKKKTNFRQSTAKELIPLRQTAERLIAHGVGNIYPDIWKHIHKEFGVEHINELLPEQIPLAISYLDALEGEYIPKQEENILFEPNQNSITVTIPKEGRWLVSYKGGKQQVVSVDGHNVVSVEYIQKLQRDSNALIELLQNFRLRTQVMQGEKSGDILNTPLIA
ncbi:phage antirepressor N-terminal domain-containing protein [Proteus mirabilis]|uniref:phage antirepressor N-terminal domain-containing protein n=1 Tax=Proteus mirabilis TaxID=584 RepID=UPI004040C005